MVEQPRIEYIEARRVLLDALGALSQQLDAVVLVGAQAVYLRTADRLPSYQPFTLDADIGSTQACSPIDQRSATSCEVQDSCSPQSPGFGRRGSDERVSPTRSSYQST